MKFHLVTLFKEACDAYLNASIIGRARKEKKITVKYQNPRDFVNNKWGKVDERPYGGGPGMVMSAMPVIRAVQAGLTPRSQRGGAKQKRNRSSFGFRRAGSNLRIKMPTRSRNTRMSYSSAAAMRASTSARRKS